jgi:hypothetical protein
VSDPPRNFRICRGGGGVATYKLVLVILMVVVRSTYDSLPPFHKEGKPLQSRAAAEKEKKVKRKKERKK